MKQKRLERPQDIESFINILNRQGFDEETVVSNPLNTNVKKESNNSMFIIGVILTIIFLLILGYFWNTPKLDNELPVVDTLSVDTSETVDQDKLNYVQTKTFTYKRDSGGNHVEYSMEYPISGNPILTRNIMEWINESLGGRYKGDLKNGQALVDFYGKEVEFDSEYNTEEKVNVKLITQTSKYVTFEFETYSYAGGAHGMGYTICATFRKDDGRKLGWDMFSNYEGLQAVIKQGLKTYFGVYTDSELEGVLLLPGGNTINSLPMSSTDPWVTPEGITFHYNAYDIASYSAGEPTFTIPAEKIRNCLTSTAIDLISE